MKKTGFTIVELLIALAITALLFATLAVAFNASAVNYRENEGLFKAVNGARQALFRIATQIRTGLVDPNDVFSADKCTLLCADGSEITYQYDANDNILYLHDNSTAADYVLCRDVTAMTFDKDNNTPTGDIKSVRITMTVNSSGAQQTLSAAAVVRKVLP